MGLDLRISVPPRLLLDPGVLRVTFLDLVVVSVFGYL